MNITYLMRSPGTGHSIETLFDGVADELRRRGQTRVQRLALPRISRGLASVVRNVWFVRRNRFAGVVHVTGDVHYAALATPAARTVLTIHDCVILNRNQHRPLRYVLFKYVWFVWPMRRAAVVTTISEATRRELRQHVGPLADRVVVVPNGYAPAFTEQPRPFDADCPMLLHIGTAPHKNLDRLLEALAGLPCRLCIVGPLSDAHRSALARYQIRHESLADVSQERMVKLYHVSDIVLFVSSYEGFGMPVLEAQATGRVVVTSCRPPMTNVGGAGACYVDPDDVADIRRGLLRVWHDAAYRDGLVRAGCANKQQYAMDQVAAQYARLYESLMNEVTPTNP